METIEEFRNLLNYNDWANRRIIASLKSSPNPSPKAIRALAHLLVAEKTWLARLQKNLDTTGFDFWPDRSLDDCSALADETARSYRELVNELTEEKLASVATYKNSKGVEYRTSYRDILMHMLMHSTYHRGQVSMAVRQGGGEPAYTDYIGFLREQQQ